jgi:hypothetical protein
MWCTLKSDIADGYLKCDPEVDLVRKLLIFETTKDLVLLDWSDLRGPDLSRVAQDTYGSKQVGMYDLPLRRYLLSTARAASSNALDGCIQWSGDEIVLDNILSLARQMNG